MLVYAKEKAGVQFGVGWTDYEQEVKQPQSTFKSCNIISLTTSTLLGSTSQITDEAETKAEYRHYLNTYK